MWGGARRSLAPWAGLQGGTSCRRRNQPDPPLSPEEPSVGSGWYPSEPQALHPEVRPSFLRSRTSPWRARRALRALRARAALRSGLEWVGSVSGAGWRPGTEAAVGAPSPLRFSPEPRPSDTRNGPCVCSGFAPGISLNLCGSLCRIIPSFSFYRFQRSSERPGILPAACSPGVSPRSRAVRSPAAGDRWPEGGMAPTAGRVVTRTEEVENVSRVCL